MRARLGIVSVLALVLGLLAPPTTLALGTLDQAQDSGVDFCGSIFSPVGQTCVAGRTGTLDTVAMYPGGEWVQLGVIVEIRTTSAGLPTSTVLASQAWTSTATSQFVDLTFATPATVTTGVTYAIVLTSTSSIVFAGCASSQYEAGSWMVTVSNGGDWSGQPEGSDLAFRTYVTSTAGAPLALGYWKNNAEVTTAALPQTLGDVNVDTFIKATAVFDASNCGKPKGDAVACLAGQLLATKLSLSAGSDQCIVPTVALADAFLDNLDYIGPTFYTLTRLERSTAIAIKLTLTNYLANLGCPA